MRSAYCSRYSSDSIIDVVMKCEGLDFDATKVQVAKVRGHGDLARGKGRIDEHYPVANAASLQIHEAPGGTR